MNPTKQIGLSSVILSEEQRQDQALMVQVSRGDRQAFEKLYLKFKGPIMSFVANMVRNQTTAEELVQEIFLKVYRSRETYQPTAKFSTWFWTIARNTTFDHLRKKDETLLDEDFDTVDLESPLSDSEAQLIENTDAERIKNCMQELTPLQRDVTLLRTVSELSYEEIAATTNTSLSSVKSLIHRAKKMLIDCMAKEEK